MIYITFGWMLIFMAVGFLLGILFVAVIMTQTGGWDVWKKELEDEYKDAEILEKYKIKRDKEQENGQTNERIL